MKDGKIEECIEEYLESNVIGVKDGDIESELRFYIHLCVKETVMAYVRDEKYKDIEKNVKNKLDLIFEKGIKL